MGDNMPSKVLTKLGHAAGAQVVLSLGGEESGKSLNAATQGAEAMAALANAVIDVAKENNYDGIDVDWEASEGTDHANLVDFVKLLRKKLKAWRPDALLLMAVPGTDWEGKWFDGPKLEPEVDFIQVMSYEFHGPWFNPQDHTYSQSGYNSPLYESDIDPVDGHNYSFQKSLEYWEKKGFQKSKIVMGIPCFGHGFAVNGWGKAPVKASKYPDIDFRKIKPLLAAGWQQHWDDQAKEPWLSSPAGDEIITYDDEKSAAAKGEWARKAGVRGIFFWEISQDYVDDHNTLVEAARAELGLPK